MPSHEIGSFPLEIFDRANRAPHPVRPGVLAAVAGPPIVAPTTSYEATIVVMNESKTTQPIGKIEITVRSKPEQAELWCTGMPTMIAGPAALEPGHVFVTRSRLACELTKIGKHDVSAIVKLQGSEATVGTMKVNVTSNPIEIVPLPPPRPYFGEDVAP
jgi:hypothetical protein